MWVGFADHIVKFKEQYWPKDAAKTKDGFRPSLKQCMNVRRGERLNMIWVRFTIFNSIQTIIVIYSFQKKVIEGSRSEDETESLFYHLLIKDELSSVNGRFHYINEAAPYDGDHKEKMAFMRRFSKKVDKNFQVGNLLANGTIQQFFSFNFMFSL